MEFNLETFFSAYREEFGALKQSQVDGIKNLLNFIKEDEEITELKWISYCFATTKHETADEYLPVTERGPKSYFNKYEPRTEIGKNLGNKVAGDGYLFRGRGYVQITGRANYRNFTSVLGVDLIADPEKALEPAIAYKIMSYGMRKGSFTGVGLSRYISVTKTDYVNARRIINGTDQAVKIAGYAEKFERILTKAKV